MQGFEECVKKGLLRRSVPSEKQAGLSMIKAKKLLDEAVKSYEMSLYESSLILSYLAMFHAARSLLFKDGWREKSHYCISRFLEEFYVKKGKLERIWVDYLDHVRDTRHETQYDLSYFPSAREAEETLKLAERFVKRIKEVYDLKTSL